MFHNEMIVEIVEYNYFLLNLEKKSKNNQKIQKNPKKPKKTHLRWVFLSGFFWVFLGGFFWVGFFGANPAVDPIDLDLSYKQI